MKITKGKLRQIIREENQRLMAEAHGLSAEDAKRVEDLISLINSLADPELKRILNFIVTSNVKVDKTQDVTKMKKPAGKK